jgi:cholesterol oxidase
MREQSVTAGTGQPVALRFTETMTGHVALGETDPQRGYEQGRRDGTVLTFRLTISTDDVDRFVREPAHQGVAEGWVECEALGGRLPVEHGEFNLFVEVSPRVRTMHYRLWFADTAGHPLTLRAHKTVTDDPGVDAWADTTTLFTEILIGHVVPADDAGATVTAAGILRIKPLHFARQLTTFRTTGGSVRDRAGGMASFGSFFMGQLWRVYAARLTSRRTT